MKQPQTVDNFQKRAKTGTGDRQSYPVMAWHPSSMILTFINEEKAGLKLYFYRIDEKVWKAGIVVFRQSFALRLFPDGTRLVMSAVKIV